MLKLTISAGLSLFMLLSVNVNASTGPTSIVRKFKKPIPLKDVSPLNRGYSDKDGFMIITTNDLTHQLKSLQKYISHKKHFRGFNVFVATENDYVTRSKMAVDAKRRGAPAGRVIGKEILNFLKVNYKKLNLKFVIFIGDARPDYGTTPMLRIAHHKPVKCKFDNYNRSSSEYAQLTPEQKLNHDKMMKLCRKSDGQYTEFGEVISDYPYVDLDTDWDANNDGFLDPKDDQNKNHKRTPEVYVGRIPYYGEDSPYGKAKDVDIILERFIRYDREKNICWRYNSMVETGKSGMYERIDFLEKNRINYQLFTRHKARAIGMPSINSRNGGTDIPNFQIIQDYGVGHYGNHSHGGPFGMEGFKSKIVANEAHDKWPTVLKLGACDIGNIKHSTNLVYTLLRFESVAASGGTGSVTNYGGKSSGAEEAGKKNMLWRGASVGENHWEWYGHLYRNTKGVPPMTACKINIYGDPSVVPYRYGLKLPYSFFADPIAGKYDLFDTRTNKTSATHTTTLENNKKTPIKIYVKSDKPWLIPNQKVVVLSPGEKKSVKFSVSNSRIIKDVPTDNGTYYRANMLFYDKTNKYKAVRPFVLKRVSKKLKNYFDFDDEDSYRDALNKDLKVNFDKSFNKIEDKSKYEKLPAVGRRGGAVSLKDFQPVISPYLTEKEDFTMSFWLKGEVPKKKPLIFSSFITLQKDSGNNYSGHFSDYREKVDKSFKFSADLAKGKWHHYLFTLNQKTGLFYVYIDGKEVVQVESKPNLIYGAQSFQFGKIDGAVDDFMLFNKYMNAKDVQNLQAGNFVEPIYPNNNERFVPNKNLVFDMVKGEGVKDSRLVLKDYKTKTVQKVKPLSDGSFMVPELTPNAKYVWNIISKTKDNQMVKTEPNLFYTSLELIENGSFEGSNDSFWEGTYKVQKQEEKKGKNGNSYMANPAISGDKSLSVNGKSKIYKVFKGALTPGKGYLFKGAAKYGKGGDKVSINAYAVNGSGSKKLIAHSSVNRKYDLGLQFKTPKSPVGRDILLEIETTPRYNNRQPWVILDNLSMVEVDGRDVNLAPEIMKGIEEKVFEVKVGTVGYAIDLNKLVKDPEGGSLTYQKISGPDWAAIQANDLFSAFGPTGEYRGKAVKFEIVAIDRSGNRTNFKITVSVK